MSYFYWLEEKLHEKETFAFIEASEWDHLKETTSSIQLVLKEKTLLPKGYTWEEEGREFSYQGMFYDIISLKKTTRGWELLAVSDEEEARMVANQSDHSTQNIFKFSKIQLIFIAPAILVNDVALYTSSLLYGNYQTYLANKCISRNFPPPETI